MPERELMTVKFIEDGGDSCRLSIKPSALIRYLQEKGAIGAMAVEEALDNLKAKVWDDYYSFACADKAAREKEEKLDIEQATREYNKSFSAKEVNDLAEDGIAVPPMEDFTCFRCEIRSYCKYAWDLYCTDHDCLADK